VRGRGSADIGRGVRVRGNRVRVALGGSTDCYPQFLLFGLGHADCATRGLYKNRHVVLDQSGKNDGTAICGQIPAGEKDGADWDDLRCATDDFSGDKIAHSGERDFVRRAAFPFDKQSISRAQRQ
jgi:hypothetical protein